MAELCHVCDLFRVALFGEASLLFEFTSGVKCPKKTMCWKQPKKLDWSIAHSVPTA